MTLPASGLIDSKKINTELSVAQTSLLSLNATNARYLAQVVPPNSTISYHSFHGKALGHRPSTFSNSGTGTFTSTASAYDGGQAPSLQTGAAASMVCAYGSYSVQTIYSGFTGANVLSGVLHIDLATSVQGFSGVATVYYSINNGATWTALMSSASSYGGDYTVALTVAPENIQVKVYVNYGWIFTIMYLFFQNSATIYDIVFIG